MKKLILDAGHGYNTAGKRTLNGANGVVREWTMNHNVCKYIAEMLKDYDVETMRSDDVTGVIDVPVQSRTDYINKIKPDLFVSIHHNANTGVWGNWSYVCAFYHVNKPKRDADLAALFAAEIAKQTGIKNNGGLPDTRSAVKSIHMVRETLSTIPSVLCEGGFMDSTIDYPIITSDKGQRAYAQAVANVCISYLGLKKNVNNTPIRGMSEIIDTNILNAFVQKNNPNFNPEIAGQFIQQGKIYNIRGDIALCQSVIETGWFKFEVTAVKPSQNNFCGMGVTSLGMAGNSFATVEQGVKAQFQHLYAYACRDALPSGEKLVDPRWSYVTRGIAPNWVDLSGKWAAATNYGQEILKKYDELKVFAAAYKPPMPKYYRVQLGAYGVKQNADNMLAKVKAAGLEAFVTPMGADKLYRVQLGAFSQKTNADAKLADVKAKGFNAFVKFE